jgi:hypothetical protein
VDVTLPPAPPAETAPAEPPYDSLEPPAADQTGDSEAPLRGPRGRAAARMAAIVLVGILWSLLLSFPFFGHGANSYVVIGDTANVTLPARLWYPANGISLFSGRWNPQGESGTDRLAGGLSPDVDLLPFALFPGWLAYGLVMWLQRAVAILAMYLLLRHVLGCERLLALGMGLLFALLTRAAATEPAWQGFAIWDGLALPALPLIPWLIWRSGSWRAYWAYPVVAVAGFLYAWTSHFFIASFALLAAGVVSLILPRRGRRPWLPLAVLLLAWLAGEGQVLWAAAANAGASHRAAWNGLVPWFSSSAYTDRAVAWLVTTLAVPLGLCLAGVVVGLVRRRWRVVGLAAVVAAFLAATALIPEIRSLIAAQAGFLSGFGWERISNLVPFVVIVTAGAGLALLPWSVDIRLKVPGRPRRLGAGGEPRRLRLTAGSMLGLAVVCFALVISVQLVARLEHARASTPSYATLFERPEEKALASLIRSQGPARVVTVYAYLTPDHARLLEPAYAWAYGLETADGFSNLYPQSYKGFWEGLFFTSAGATVQPITFFRRGGSQVRLYTATRNLTVPAGIYPAVRWRMQFLSLANVRYLISPIRLQGSPPKYALTPLALDPASGRLVAQHLAGGELPRPAGPTPPGGQTIYIYENMAALPRAFLTGTLQSFSSPAGVLAKMRASGVRELSRSAFVISGDLPAGAAALLLRPPPKAGLNVPVGTADISASSTDALSVTTVASKPSVLAFSVSHSPFWKAWVDGRSAPVMRTDYTFMGVVLTAGRHQVVLKYQPPQRSWPIP